MIRKITVAAFAAFCLLSSPAIVTPVLAGTYEDNVFRPGEPRWGPYRGYEDRNIRRHGNSHVRGSFGRSRTERGGYYESHSWSRRTCRDWVQPGGVGPKITIRTYSC